MVASRTHWLFINNLTMEGQMITSPIAIAPPSLTPKASAMTPGRASSNLSRNSCIDFAIPAMFHKLDRCVAKGTVQRSGCHNNDE